VVGGGRCGDVAGRGGAEAVRCGVNAGSGRAQQRNPDMESAIQWVGSTRAGLFRMSVKSVSTFFGVQHRGY